MVHRQHERGARLEHPVHLAQRAAEVVIVVEAVVGEHEVDRAARGEPEVGQLALVALDGHARRRRRRPEVGDAIGVRIEGDGLRPTHRQGHRVAGDPQLDHALPAAHVAEHVQLVIVGHTLAVRHPLAHWCTSHCGGAHAHAWCTVPRRRHWFVARSPRPVRSHSPRHVVRRVPARIDERTCRRGWLAWPTNESVRRCIAWSVERTRPDRPSPRPPTRDQRVPPRPAQPGAGLRRPSRADQGGDQRRHPLDDGVPDL